MALASNTHIDLPWNLPIESITVDPGFKGLLGRLSPDERGQLTRSIKLNGIEEALYVWPHDGKYKLLDGHERIDIAAELGLSTVPVRYVELFGVEEALAWIVEHQQGRRNWNPYCKFIAAMGLMPKMREEARRRQQSGVAGDTKREMDVAVRLAKDVGVSRSQAQKMLAVYRGAPPEMHRRVTDGELSVNAAYTVINQKPPRQLGKCFALEQAIDIDDLSPVYIEMKEDPKSKPMWDVLEQLRHRLNRKLMSLQRPARGRIVMKLEVEIEGDTLAQTEGQGEPSASPSNNHTSQSPLGLNVLVREDGEWEVSIESTLPSSNEAIPIETDEQIDSLFNLFAMDERADVERTKPQVRAWGIDRYNNLLCEDIAPTLTGSGGANCPPGVLIYQSAPESSPDRADHETS